MIREVSQRAVKARLTRKLAKAGAHLRATKYGFVVINQDNEKIASLSGLEAAARFYGVISAMEKISNEKTFKGVGQIA
jgi:hypothetical protein